MNPRLTWNAARGAVSSRPSLAVPVRERGTTKPARLPPEGRRGCARRGRATLRDDAVRDASHRPVDGQRGIWARTWSTSDRLPGSDRGGGAQRPRERGRPARDSQHRGVRRRDARTFVPEATVFHVERAPRSEAPLRGCAARQPAVRSSTSGGGPDGATPDTPEPATIDVPAGARSRARVPPDRRRRRPAAVPLEPRPPVCGVPARDAGPPLRRPVARRADSRPGDVGAAP
jgi:hypothetical protein